MLFVLLLAVSAYGDSLFAAWLSKISVELPEQVTVQTPFEIGLRNITCGGFTIDALPSRYLAPLRLNVAGRGLSFACNMTFSYKNMYFPYLPSGSGQVHIDGADSSIELALSLDTLIVNKQTYLLPRTVVVDQCKSLMNVKKLDLSSIGLGETVSSILSLVISSSVELLLPTVICDEISSLIQQNMTDELSLINEQVILPLLTYPFEGLGLPFSINVPLNSFDWQSPLFQLITAALDDDGVAEIRYLMRVYGLIDSTVEEEEGLEEKEAEKEVQKQWCELTSNIDGPGINTLMNIAVNEEGVISFEAPSNTTFVMMEDVISLTVNHVNITGLSAFKNFSLLRTANTNASFVDNYVLTSLMTLPNLQMLFDGVIHVRFDANTVLHERALINVSLIDLNAYMTSVSVLDLDHLRKLYVGQLSSVSCWLTSFSEMNVTDLGVFLKLEANLPVLFDQGVEKDFALAISRVLQLIEQDFGASVSRTISGLAVSFRDMFNSDFTNGSYQCPMSFTATDSLLDWRANAHPVAWIDDLLSAILVEGIMKVTIHNGNETSVKEEPAVNGLLDCVTANQKQAGVYEAEGDLFSLRLGSGEEQFELVVKDLVLEGLDSFDQLSLFTPVSSNAVRLGFVLRNCSTSNICKGFKTKLSVSVRVGSAVPSVAVLSLAMQEFVFDSQLHLPLNLGTLNRLRVEELLNLQCVFSVFPSVAVDSLQIAVGSLLAELKLDQSSAEQFDVTKSANQLLSSLPSALIKVLNDELASLSLRAPALCRGQVPPPSAVLMSSRVKAPVVMGVTALTLAILLGGVMIFASCKNNKVLPSREVPLLAPEDFTLEGSSPSSSPSSSSSSSEAAVYSLAKHPRLSRLVRVCVPLILVCAIVLLITAHVSSGARVTLWISSEGSPPALFATVSEFTLAASVADMWSAGVPLLAVLVALLSGFWPYIKLCAMLVCWFLPSFNLHTQKRCVNRGCVLSWLHTLGKWSLIDAFVLAVMMVAFRFHISPKTALPFLDASLYLDVTLEPEWGITGFILATIVSMLMSEVCMWAHYKAQGEGEKKAVVSSGRFALWRQIVNRYPLCWQRRGVKLGLGAVLVATLLLPVGLVWLDLLGFQFSGLVALLMSPNQRHQSFTAVSFASSMLPASLIGGFDTWLLKWNFVLHAILVPIVHALGVCILLFAPLHSHHRLLLHRYCAVISSWACLDVLFASLLGGLLQLGLVAEYLVGDFCQPVDAALELMGVSTAAKPLLCFGVAAEFRPGLFILLTASVLLQVTFLTISRLLSLEQPNSKNANELQERSLTKDGA